MDIVTGGNGSKPRPGFYDKPVRIMSIVVIVLGIASFGLGAYILVDALTSMCTYEEYSYDYDNDWWTSTTTTTTTTERTYKARCRFYATYLSPGLWGGAMFIASGIIGVMTANRKSTCFILTLMIMSFTTAVTAACSATASIAGNFDYMGGYNTYPLSLHIASSFNAFLSLICFVLSLIKFGFACRAVCCNASIGIPKIERSGYKPLPNQPAMLAPMMSNQPSMPAPMMSYLPPAQQQTSDQAPSQVPMPVFQQGNQPNNVAQPVYLVQGHQIIGMLSPSMQMMTANVAQTPGPSVPPPAANVSGTNVM